MARANVEVGLCPENIGIKSVYSCLLTESTGLGHGRSDWAMAAYSGLGHGQP